MATYVLFQSVLSVNEECLCWSCANNKCTGPKPHQHDQGRAASLLLAGRGEREEQVLLQVPKQVWWGSGSVFIYHEDEKRNVGQF